MKLTQLTATELVERVNASTLTAVEITAACLAEIAAHDARLHAWAHVDPDTALRQAKAIDVKRAAGRVGALAGVPIGIKDIFNTVDMPTQMGSPIWSQFTPGNDARVVHSIRMADGVVLGKTVTAEFAVHTPGPTRNPHNLAHTPGTSSSGSAAAVAACMVPLAIGTQSAGSTIRPASYCGVFGFKPSFGLIPRTGMLKTTDTLDTVGVIARSVDDVELLFDRIRVHGQDYPLSHAALNDSARQGIGDRPWRIGLLEGPTWPHSEAYAKQALAAFGQRLAGVPGVEVERVTLPEIFNRSHDIHAAIYDRSLAYYFREDVERGTPVSARLAEIMTRGNRVCLQDYKVALDAQADLARRFDRFLAERFDLLVGLSTGGEALEGLDSVDRLDDCLIWTLCGVPALNLPVFRGPQGLPFGAQIVARRYSDPMLLGFARMLVDSRLVTENALNHHGQQQSQVST